MLKCFIKLLIIFLSLVREKGGSLLNSSLMNKLNFLLDYFLFNNKNNSHYQLYLIKILLKRETLILYINF